MGRGRGANKLSDTKDILFNKRINEPRVFHAFKDEERFQNLTIESYEFRNWNAEFIKAMAAGIDYIEKSDYSKIINCDQNIKSIRDYAELQVSCMDALRELINIFHLIEHKEKYGKEQLRNLLYKKDWTNLYHKQISEVIKEFESWVKDSNADPNNSPILKEAKLNWEAIRLYKESTLSPQGYHTYSLFQTKRLADQLKDSAQVNKFWKKHVDPVLQNNPNEEQIKTLYYLTQGLLLAETHAEQKKAKAMIEKISPQAKEIVANEKAAEADIYSIPTAWMKIINSNYDSLDGASGATFAELPGIVAINTNIINRDKPETELRSLLVHELTHVSQDLGSAYFKGNARIRNSMAIVEGCTEVMSEAALNKAGYSNYSDSEDITSRQGYGTYLGYTAMIKVALEGKSKEEQVERCRKLTSQENDISEDYIANKLFPELYLKEDKQQALLNLVDKIQNSWKDLSALNNNEAALLDWIKNNKS